MPYVLLSIILLSVYPFVLCQFLPIPPINILAIGYLLLLSTLFAFKRHFLIFPCIFNISFFLQVCCWAFFFLYHNDTSYVVRIILLMVAYLALLYAYNAKNGLLAFVKLFNNTILLMAIMGTIAFFLVMCGNMLPLFNFSNVDGRTAYCYGLTCTNFVAGNIIRYSGYFDEPGAMAYWGIFALIFNRLFFCNNRYERVLMICLIFTFSIAYYIQLCFFVLFAKNKMKVMGVASLILLLVVWGVFQTKGTDYDIYRFTIERFEMNERTGEIAGDNRSNLAQLAKEQFIKAPILGIGAKNMEQIGYMADNPYEIVAKDGLVGEIVTYLPLLLIVLYGIKRRNLYYVYAALILFVGYQQRPFHVDLIHPIMLYLFTILVIEDRKHLSNESCSLDCNSSVQC